ncbi:MAG: riboflavin synthase [Deltaproteobacteria bacterium]|nr:riboflavin synthase [Deltaproteobacteria bacterium]
MFTGIIEDVGRVHEWQLKRGSGVLTLNTHLPSREIGPGSSVAVNGACLTVVKRAKGRFTVEVSPETLKRTSLSSLKVGDPVNLELPLKFHDRLGGHLVTGHVDGVAVTDEIRKRGKFTFLRFLVPAALAPLLVPKGSVAVDGISLTVNECGKRYFSVAIIPFTLRHTNLRGLRVGDKVNVEADIIGKYVKSLARFHHRTGTPRHSWRQHHHPRRRGGPG